jgi:transcriptional regulator GlxA family with amidase domain
MSEYPSQKRKVALVGYPGVQSLDLVGPMEVFSMANRFGQPDGYEVILASPSGGTIVCNSGLQLAGSVALADLPDDLDTVLVAGGNQATLREVSERPTLDWLCSRSRSTRRLGSVCSGALILAAAGVLDGRRATTHWDYCEELRTFRPAVKVEPDAIFVADPRALRRGSTCASRSSRRIKGRRSPSQSLATLCCSCADPAARPSTAPG